MQEWGIILWIIFAIEASFETLLLCKEHRVHKYLCSCHLQHSGYFKYTFNQLTLLNWVRIKTSVSNIQKNSIYDFRLTVWVKRIHISERMIPCKSYYSLITHGDITQNLIARLRYSYYQIVERNRTTSK